MTNAQAEDLLSQDTSMPKDVRAYVLGLILRAREVLEHLETYGPETVRQVALELGGALHAQGERETRNGDPERGSRWKAAAMSLLLGFAGGAGGGTADALGETIHRAIER